MRLEVTQRGDSLRAGEIADRIREQLGESLSAHTISGVLRHQLTNKFTGKGEPLRTWSRIS